MDKVKCLRAEKNDVSSGHGDTMRLIMFGGAFYAIFRGQIVPSVLYFFIFYIIILK